MLKAQCLCQEMNKGVHKGRFFCLLGRRRSHAKETAGERLFILGQGEDMGFQELFNNISPKLKRIANSHKIYGLSVDRQDLYQEMCIHLWNNFKNGVPQGINETYIVRGCLFHMLNYLRKQRKSVFLVRLDEPINEQGATLADVLPDKNESAETCIDRQITINDIRNNGFTSREKEVFSLLLQHYTVREIGLKLGISHVRVVKIKSSLVRKWHKKDK